MNKALFIYIFLFPLLVGCAGLGKRVDSGTYLDKEPELGAILLDLAANDAVITDFRGGGTFTLESPDFEATRRFRGSIKFRRPADLYVQGNHRITNVIMFKLMCVGNEFLMEFPTDKNQSFYQLEGEDFVDLPFSVSPSDIAREMFLPEIWGELRAREVRVSSSDESTGTIALDIGPRRDPRRRVWVQRVDAELPRWVWVRSERLLDGETIAITEASSYRELDGMLFPTQVDAHFPTEETRMTFVMRNIKLNTQLEDTYFDILGRAKELNLEKRHGNLQTLTQE